MIALASRDVVDIDIDVPSRDDLLEILEGIRETRAYLLRQYGVSSREELLEMINRSRLSRWDASIDLLRLDVLDEMENIVLELLMEDVETHVAGGLLDLVKRIPLFRRIVVKEAMT